MALRGKHHRGREEEERIFSMGSLSLQNQESYNTTYFIRCSEGSDELDVAKAG